MKPKTLKDYQILISYISGCCCRHPKFVMFIITLSLMLLGHGLAIHFLYFHQASGWQTCDQNTNNNCVSLKILSLNTWGMPAIFGSKYKTPRIEAISEIIAKEEYDIFLLQELWMEADHNVIASKVPKNYFITGFRQLSTELCDGHLSPGFCSGLAIGNILNNSASNSDMVFILSLFSSPHMYI